VRGSPVKDASCGFAWRCACVLWVADQACIRLDKSAKSCPPRSAPDHHPDPADEADDRHHRGDELYLGLERLYGALIYLATPEKFTLALGLRYFDSARPGQLWGIPQDHYMMAAVVMSTTPVILLFFAAQRYFVQGIVMSGIKG
jgi:hypothetical protein